MTQKSVWKPNLRMMTQNNIQYLVQSAIYLLGKTGLNVHHAELRKKLFKAGASLTDEIRIKFPPEMIDRAIESARRPVVIYDRMGEAVMPLGPHDIYFGTGSDLIYTWDSRDGERRESVLDDVGRSARLCDALDEIDFVMSFALPKDVPNENAEPMQFYTLLHNTIKPIIMTSFSGQEAFERMHEMACTIAGGDSAFRKRPNYIMYGQFVSPFQHDTQSLERLIFCAEKEIPLIYIPTIIPSASGPITLAGSITVAIAECLGGLVMHQVQNPGAPFIFGGCVSPMNMRTMLYPYGSPEWRINDLVMAELSRYFQLPVFGTAGATDSKTLDAQSGLEYANSMLVAAMAGTNLIHDVGYMDSGLTGSLESIILGAEQVRWVKRFMNGLEVTDETLALDLIDRVGPAGQFLDQKHTIKHLRNNLWKPLVLDHEGYDVWDSRGRQDYQTRARAKAREILEEHQVPSIDEKAEKELLKLCEVPG